MLEHPKSTSAKIVVQGTSDPASSGAQAIDRAATLLLLVGRAGPTGARLSHLVEQCNLPKPTVRRMLLALVRAGLLDQDQKSRRYYIGPEIYVLGTLASARFGIHSISLRSLARLSQETGDTAFLSVPRDVYSICVHREEGPYPIRIHALHAGDRHPLGVGAGSLALLATLPDRDVDEILAANADLLAQKYPRFSPDMLRGLVQETRARGYAVNPGLILSDSWAIGIAICGADGRPAGALSIAAIESRLTETRQRELVPLLRKEAAWIEARLRAGDIGRATEREGRKCGTLMMHSDQQLRQSGDLFRFGVLSERLKQLDTFFRYNLRHFGVSFVMSRDDRARVFEKVSEIARNAGAATGEVKRRPGSVRFGFAGLTGLE